MQMVGLDDLVMKELYKHVSVSLCPNTLGQVLVRYIILKIVTELQWNLSIIDTLRTTRSVRGCLEQFPMYMYM